jgi:sensor domain CHASE-containing protein
MSFRRKLIIIHIAIFFSLLLVQFLLSRYFTLSGFSELEINRTNLALDRVLNTLSRELDTIAKKNYDWSAWDDTYQFMSDRNQEYIDSNLQDQTLFGLDINMMLFYDTNEDIVLSRSVNLDKGAASELSTTVKGMAGNFPDFFEHTAPQSVKTGMLEDQNKLLLVASRPIVMTDESGPVRGTVVFGRYLDENLLEEIEFVTLEEISTFPVTGLNQENPVRAYSYLKDFPDASFFSEEGNNTIEGYALIKDLAGKDLALINITRERTILAYGLSTINLSLISIILIGVIFGIILILLIERSISSPVSTLINALEKISKTGNFNDRIIVSQDGEIGSLQKNINSLLEKISTSEQELKRRNEQIEQRNSELDELNQALTGREGKMIELKKEIDELKIKTAGSPDQP